MANNLEGFIWVPSMNLHVATSLLKVTPEMLAQAKQMGLEEIDYDFLKSLSPEKEYTWLEPREAESFIRLHSELCPKLIGLRMQTQEEHRQVVEWANRERGPLYESLKTQGPEIVSVSGKPEGFVYAFMYPPKENDDLKFWYDGKLDFAAETGVREVMPNLD